MYEQIKKPKENKSRAIANAFTQKKTVQQQGFGFVDNRPEAVAQRKLNNEATNANRIAKRKVDEKVLQLKTDIGHRTGQFTYQTRNSTQTETVGIHMKAFLDPAQPVSGSEPGASEQKDLMKRLKGKYNLASWALIKGHLLNHDLGGFGVAENLFPITKDANGAHLHAVEYGMKYYLAQVENNRNNGVNPDGVFYEVKVQSGLDENNFKNGSKFICNAWTVNNIDGNQEKNTKFVDNIVIESQPGTNVNEEGWAHDEEDESADYFSHATSPNTWGHNGKGRRGRKGSSDWDKEGRISMF